MAAFTCALPPENGNASSGTARDPARGWVTAGGSKSFILETRVHEGTMRKEIGDAKAWPITKALEEATRLRRLTDQKLDPHELEREQATRTQAARRKAESEARPGELFVSDAWDTDLSYQRERIVRKHHDDRWGKRHVHDHERLS